MNGQSSYTALPGYFLWSPEQIRSTGKAKLASVLSKFMWTQISLPAATLLVIEVSSYVLCFSESSSERLSDLLPNIHHINNPHLLLTTPLYY